MADDNEIRSTYGVEGNDCNYLQVIGNQNTDFSANWNTRGVKSNDTDNYLQFVDIDSNNIQTKNGKGFQRSENLKSNSDDHDQAVVDDDCYYLVDDDYNHLQLTGDNSNQSHYAILGTSNPVCV